MAIDPARAVGPPLPTVATSRPAPAKEPAKSGAPASPPEQQVSVDQVRQALKEVQKAVAPVAQNLQFSIDSETGKTVVRVVDAMTQEVVRQIPSEEIIAIAHALDRMQGLLLKQKA